MAWYVNYTHEWYADNEDVLRIDFLRDLASQPSIVEMSGQPSPFVLSYTSDDVMSSIKSGGAKLSMLSETDMQYSNPGFIGNDPKEWRVQFYRNSTLEWFGYLRAYLSLVRAALVLLHIAA